MSEYRKCYVTKNGLIKGSALADRVNCQMIRWMRRLHRKKKKLLFIVVELKMAEIGQANSHLTVDEEGCVLETPKKDLLQEQELGEEELVAVLEQMDKLESDLKESFDQVKEMEKKADDKEQLPELGEEELVAVMERKMAEDKEDCLEALKVAGGVERTKGESFYKTLFGMIIKDSVDAILKREVIYLTAQMCCFRNNIAKKITC